ncbi:MAG: Trk system potassium transporter TrkA [Eubacteriales bacterium]|nr:Trk system potassium transporter TrkA [Eubacteriales bacterium]
MNIVIVGGGKVGYALASQLCNEGHDVTVIDNNSERTTLINDSLDVITFCGSGASYVVQKDAGVEDADLLIAATGADEINMLCCMVGKKVGAKHTIARVRNPEYHQQMFFLREELGLSLVINPEQAAAQEISRMLRFPSAIKVEPFAKGKVELVELRLKEDSPLDGVMLKDLRKKMQINNVLICAVERDDVVTIPTGNFALCAGDRLTLIAPPQDAEAFFKYLGAYKRRIKNVIIIGGGRISYYLARQLNEVGIHTKIVERDEARCRELCELVPKAIIICGDGADQDLLREEGIMSADAFVALTGLDEENIILSMYAHKCSVEKVITKVSKTSYIDMLNSSALESFICPKDITSHQILQYVRAMQNSFGSNVETLYRIVDERVEALEFHVRDNARVIGIPLKDIPLKDGLLIGAIIRRGRCIIPSGNDTIEPDDSVIVVTTDRGLCELDSIRRED